MFHKLKKKIIKLINKGKYYKNEIKETSTFCIFQTSDINKHLFYGFHSNAAEKNKRRENIDTLIKYNSIRINIFTTLLSNENYKFSFY